MTTQMTAVDRAQLIADRAEQVARIRATTEHPWDWTSGQSYTDYVTMVSSIEAWVEGPRWDPVVVVCPRMHPHGGYWSGTSAAVLDTAVGQVDTEIGDYLAFRLGCIEQDGDSYEARLRVTWPAGTDPGCGDCDAEPGEACTDTRHSR